MEIFRKCTTTTTGAITRVTHGGVHVQRMKRQNWFNSLVTATWRFDLPSSITSMTSSGLETKRSVQPWNTRRQRGEGEKDECRCCKWTTQHKPSQRAPCSYPRGRTSWSLSLWRIQRFKKQCGPGVRSIYSPSCC